MLAKIKASLKKRYAVASPGLDEEPDFGAPEPVYRDLSEDELDLWQETSSLDALHLAPLEGPYLTAMHAKVVRREELLMGRPWDRSESLSEHIKHTLKDSMTETEASTMVGHGYALLDDAGMSYPPSRNNSIVLDDEARMLVDKPSQGQRPPLIKRPYSERAVGEPPLLQQALRRQHQFGLSKRILQDIYHARDPQPARPSLLRNNYSLIEERSSFAVSRPVSPKSRAISLDDATQCVSLNDGHSHQADSHPSGDQQKHGRIL